MLFFLLHCFLFTSFFMINSSFTTPMSYFCLSTSFLRCINDMLLNMLVINFFHNFPDNGCLYITYISKIGKLYFKVNSYVLLLCCVIHLLRYLGAGAKAGVRPGAKAGTEEWAGSGLGSGSRLGSGSGSGSGSGFLFFRFLYYHLHTLRDSVSPEF